MGGVVGISCFRLVYGAAYVCWFGDMPLSGWGICHSSPRRYSLYGTD